jgi:hypothetical protein
MRKYNKKANYNANPNYLDFLDAMRKFFTNDQDIIPIISEFNFYINGVYSIPYTDLFRMYDENLEDIHGPEKTKQFIDDGTIGIINEAIYKIGKGSLLTALENTRVLLENKKAAYNVGFNPMSKTYTEALKPVVNVLPDGNPVVTNLNKNQLTQEEVNEIIRLAKLQELERNAAKPDLRNPVDPLKDTIKAPTTGSGAKKKAKKSFWKYLSFLSHPKNKKINKSGPMDDFDYYTKNKKNFDGNNY